MKEYRIIVGDLRTKDTYIRDQQKKIRELEAELIDFVHAYDVSVGSLGSTVCVCKAHAMCTYVHAR